MPGTNSAVVEALRAELADFNPTFDPHSRLAEEITAEDPETGEFANIFLAAPGEFHAIYYAPGSTFPATNRKHATKRAAFAAIEEAAAA